MSEVSSNVVPMPGATAIRIQETGVLLERPRYKGTPRHDVVYGFVGGRVGSAPLARYRLPASLRGDTLIIPSATNGDGLAMLPVLAQVADRIAPWVPVHIVPQILRKRREGYDFARAEGSYEVDGNLYAGYGGVAYYNEGLVLLQSGCPAWMAHSLFHELFHIVWYRHLSDAACDVLTDAVGSGPSWPSDYYSSVSERVARLFESWAWSRLEGVPCVDPVPMTVAGIFEFVWSGGLADHQIRLGLVPNAEALRVRRGLPELPPTEPEAVEVEAEEPEDDTDSMIALISELAAATARVVVRLARWAWHGPVVA